MCTAGSCRCDTEGGSRTRSAGIARRWATPSRLGTGTPSVYLRAVRQGRHTRGGAREDHTGAVLPRVRATGAAAVGLPAARRHARDACPLSREPPDMACPHASGAHGRALAQSAACTAARGPAGSGGGGGRGREVSDKQILCWSVEGSLCTADSNGTSLILRVPLLRDTCVGRRFNSIQNTRPLSHSQWAIITRKNKWTGRAVLGCIRAILPSGILTVIIGRGSAQ